METGDIYHWVGSGRCQGNKQKENECEMEDNESNRGMFKAAKVYTTSTTVIR